MSDANELEELRDLVVSLTDRIDSMQSELDQRSDPTVPELAPAVTRRGWMKAAAAAAVGGTAVALGGADRVAAGDTDPIRIGQTDNEGASRTESDHTGAAGAGVSFLFKTGIAANGATSDFPAALAGWSGSDVRPHGVHGLAGSPGGEGVGVVGEAISDRGTGVRGTGWYGVIGSGTDYGVAGTGSKGSLLIRTSGFVPPTEVPVEALPGALYGETTDPFSNTGSVWCAVSRSGEWRKLAGFDTAGSLHPIEPTRVYDSRLPLPDPGKLAAGDDRVFSVADGRDLDTGAVTAADLVPAGTLAIAYNLTVTETEGAGFLAVTPGDASEFKASTINWSGNDQNVANAGIVPIDGMRQLKAFCGGTAQTHFLVDITGYYL